MLKRAHDALERQLQAAWALRAPDTPLKSADEALTLASVVEKETGAAADRGKVAAVFTNRLRLGMPLQSDPTVIYGLGDGLRRQPAQGRPADRHALQLATPATGLPPTPIALPGRDALRAAVRPDATKALYFVVARRRHQRLQRDAQRP